MSRKTDNPGTGIKGEKVGGRPDEDESVHFMICPECGQAIDKRDLGQVAHHMELGHAPLRDNA
jgi:hypothetical protein